MKKTQDINEAALRTIYKSFRKQQQANKFISDDLGTGLHITESYMLLELDTRESAAPADFCYQFELEKSVVSRHLSRLCELGLVEVSKPQSDGRAIEARITRKGRAFLKRYDAFNQKALKPSLRRVTPKEISRLVYYHAHMSDRLEAPVSAYRKTDLPILSEMRRITKRLGLFRRTFMGSDLNMPQWHVLSEVAESSRLETPQALSQSLSLPLRAISRISGILERKGYLRQMEHPGDRRKILLELTATGQSALEVVENGYIALLRKATAGLPARDLDEFKRILAKFSGIADSSEDVGLPSRYRIRLLRGEPELKEARAFLVESLILLGRHTDLSYSIMSPYSLCFELLLELRRTAVIEIAYCEGSACVANFVYRPGFKDKAAIDSFISLSTKRALDILGLDKVEIPEWVKRP